MDQLLEFAVLAIKLWRTLLCVAVGAVIALLINALIPGLPPAASFTLVFIAASMGVVWHVGVLSEREATSGLQAQKTISRPVAFLAIAMVGGLWGSLAEAVVGPVFATAAVLVAPSLLAPLFASIAKQRIGARATAFATVASLVGLVTPHAVRLVLFSAAGA